MFKSIDGGGSWSAVNSGLTNPYVSSMAIDPTNPQTIYVGTLDAYVSGAGVYKSTNGGGSWNSVNSGLVGSGVSSLAIDPTSPQTIYAGTSSGIFKSINGGSFWSAVNSGLSNYTNVSSLAIDPSSPQTVYAGTSSGGVFKSINGGSFWSTVNSGLTGTYLKVYSLAIDLTSPQIVYAGTGGSGVFKGLSVPDVPTISGIPATIATVGIAYSFTPTVTNATSFNITSIPPGLNFNTTTGTLSGTPTTVGAYSNIVIIASNSSGSTALPVFTVTVTATVPGAPTGVSAIAGNAKTTVSFTAPASNGGSAITSNTVSSSPGNFTTTGSASPITVTGLTNGTAYTFTVTATNAAGTGVASMPSASVTPITVPGAPTGVSAITANAQATVSFTAPASNGGSAITSYTVSSSPGNFTATGSASPITVTGLTNGTAYTFTVTAINVAGTGAGSTPSTSITPVVPDTTPPTLILSSLAHGAITNNATLNISGTVTDPSGVDSLTINTVSVAIGAGGNFSSVFTLQPGANTIITTAVDAFGNETTDTRTITLDQNAPILTVITPVDNSATATVQTSITGSCGDASSVIVKVNTNTPQIASITSGSYTLVVTLNEGQNTLTVTATDAIGNSNSIARTITYDSIAPTLAITTPVADMTTHSMPYTISGTVEDALTDVSLTMTVNGQVVVPTINGADFSYQLQSLRGGSYQLVVTAKDLLENSATVMRNVIYEPYGDINYDGVTTSADALPALQMAIGKKTVDLKGDVAPLINGVPVPDGKVTAADALVILRKAVGLW